MSDYNNDIFKNLANALQGFAACSEKLYQEQVNAALSNSVQSLSDAIKAVVQYQIGEIQPSIESTVNLQAVSDVLTAQLLTIKQSLYNVQTPGIEALLDSFRHGAWITGMASFIGNLNSGFADVADLALLKNNSKLQDLVDGGYPPRLNGLLDKLLKRTGERLAKISGLKVSVQDHIFKTDDNNISANIESINVAASSTELFADITETELINFLDVLSNYGELALTDPTGIKIWEIIKNWNNFQDFDREFYFHSRPKRRKGLPFTSDEMGKALKEKVLFGRFNKMKQSHYYFADTQGGAESEVRKHNHNAEIQTARLRPIKPIRMIDLSEEVKSSYNLFLQYLRYEPAYKDEKPQEYLLPEFVASCCIKAKIEGIKYYGSKLYNNYVSWKDGYFDVDLCW